MGQNMEQYLALTSHSLTDADTTLFTNPDEEAVCSCAHYQACLQLDGSPLKG